MTGVQTCALPISTGADGTPAQLARAHRTVLPAALIRPRPHSAPAHGSRGAVGAARHLGWDKTECPPLPPTGGRWYAGAIGASSPHGPSRSTHPTQAPLSPRTWQSGGRGGRPTPRLGQNGVPAPPPDRGRWLAGAIGASSPHGSSRGCRLPCSGVSELEAARVVPPASCRTSPSAWVDGTMPASGTRHVRCRLPSPIRPSKQPVRIHSSRCASYLE